jgi:hypothetical protein
MDAPLTTRPCLQVLQQLVLQSWLGNNISLPGLALMH